MLTPNMFTMRSLVATAFVAEATVLNQMDQGAPFNQCIDIRDFERETLASDITLVNRDANGCCPLDYIPGVWLADDYQGAQVVGGVGANGVVTRDLGTAGACTYGQCYIYKQDLDCADGAKQRLNGCCGRGNARLNFQADLSCLGYELDHTSIWGETAEYCTTYRSNYGACGSKGTNEVSEDVANGMLVPANIGEYAQCSAVDCATSAAVVSDTCDGAGGNFVLGDGVGGSE